MRSVVVAGCMEADRQRREQVSGDPSASVAGRWQLASGIKKGRHVCDRQSLNLRRDQAGRQKGVRRSREGSRSPRKHSTSFLSRDKSHDSRIHRRARAERDQKSMSKFKCRKWSGHVVRGERAKTMQSGRLAGEDSGIAPLGASHESKP